MGRYLCMTDAPVQRYEDGEWKWRPVALVDGNRGATSEISALRYVCQSCCGMGYVERGGARRICYSCGSWRRRSMAPSLTTIIRMGSASGGVIYSNRCFASDWGRRHDQSEDWRKWNAPREQVQLQARLKWDRRRGLGAERRARCFERDGKRWLVCTMATAEAHQEWEASHPREQPEVSQFTETRPWRLGQIINIG